MAIQLPPDGVREREVHRFYQPWIETFRVDDFDSAKNPKPPREDGHVPRSSNDKALTAFAQLGCLRVGAKRGIVTLIDGSYQYILAEATKSLSLMDDSYHAEGDELWLGNAIVPRSQGVSENALYPPLYTALGSNGSSHSSPALVISDLAASDRYKTRRYAGTGINFYAGVPIVTNAGYPIGVYTVSDDKPRDGLTLDEFRFMTDMATIVAQHLEYVKNDRARARGTKLVQGIGSFMRGKSEDLADTVHALYPSPDDSPGTNLDEVLANPFAENAISLSERKKVDGKPFKGLTISNANLYGGSAPPSPRPSKFTGGMIKHSEASKPAVILRSHSEHIPGDRQNLRPRDKPNQEGQPVDESVKARDKAASDYVLAFQRAARILCDCMSSDGVAFLDASSANLSQGTNRSNPTDIPGTAVEHGKRSKSNVLHNGRQRKVPALDQYAEDRSELEVDSTDSTYSGDEDTSSKSAPSTHDLQETQFCEVLAVTFRSEQEKRQICVLEKEVRRAIRRHPEGKHYSFDESGSTTFTDQLLEPKVKPPDILSDILKDPGNDQGSDESGNALTGRRKHALLRALPGARNIVFLPLWDLTRQRWNSALIIWSTSPGPLANINDDLSYLTAFANSVMNEIARLDLAISEKAKTRFLANISHELRSPLHGILGSIEFLHDTAMDDFQSSLVVAVETCGKTLLDTVNHVLDYSKIRTFTKQDQNKPVNSLQRSLFESSDNNNKNNDNDLVEEFDLATIVEESVEAVYAGQVFRNTNTDVFYSKVISRLSPGKKRRDSRSIKDNSALSSALTKAPVSLILVIDFEDNWMVVSQPGALRRIVMNLLGNALKYTERGLIEVMLQIDKTRKRDSYIHACLTVSDTGKGMSDDFLRNHAFTAFSQENPLASGTGLGLSIVRQIVDSLGGKIDLHSQQNIGTDIKIWLSLPLAPLKTGEAFQDSNHIVSHLQKKVQSSSICLLKPKSEEFFKQNERQFLAPMSSIYQTLEDLLRDWFQTDPFVATEMNAKSADFFIYAEPPSIEYLLEHHSQNDGRVETPIIILCTNAFEAASLRASGLNSLTELGRIIEIISQPCGPQKMAMVLQRCLLRKKGLRDSSNKRPSEPTRISLNIDNELAEPILGSSMTRSLSPAHGPSVENLKNDADQNYRRVREENPQPEERQVSNLVSKEKLEDPGQLESPTKNQLPRVLVVDDNPINLQLLVTFVRKSDHPYASAINGLEALESYKQGVTDVTTPRFKYVLMDISMPVMDGIRSCREIRAFEKANLVHPPAIIIALTGLGSENAQQDAYAAGFDHFMSKPVKFKELLRQLI